MTKKVHFGSTAAVEVEIAEGLTYNKLAPTRSVQRKINAAIDAADTAEVAGDDDAVIAAFADVYDYMLKPCGTNRKKASTFIKEQWQSDQLTFPQIFEHLEELGQIRPT